MIRTLIALQLCSWAAGVERYGDYSGARMPLYNMEDGGRSAASMAEEYADRSPDASPHLDYKYEDEVHDKIDKLRAKIESEDEWHISHKKIEQPSEDYGINKSGDEYAPKFEMNHRNRKYKTRFKSRISNTENVRRAPNYVRSRKIDKDDVDIRKDYYINKGKSREDNSLDSDQFDYRETTEKLIRRKARDRTIDHRRLNNEDAEEEVETKTRRRVDDAENIEDQPKRHRGFLIERPHPPDMSKLKPKNYPEYDDYYDMKRVNNIKNKLPGLLRNTKASTTETSRTRRLLDISYRRANAPMIDTESTERNSINATAKETTIASIHIKTDVASLSSNSTELSLAEKSRLSILKKAQRKENVRNVTWTTKPPVLMQMTPGMHTLVMVEPPQQRNVQLRAREVFDDSPERIAQAKKLMRHKLVADARNIHDLTDNWDDMVCDYIDVSLLDGGCTSVTSTFCRTIFLSIISLLSSDVYI